MTTELKEVVKSGAWLRPQRAAEGAVAIIRELDQLDELAKAWDLLAEKSGCPMHHYAWFRACATALAIDGELQVVVVGAPPQAFAIAPLVRRGNRLARLEFLGVNELGEPVDFLYAEPSALGLLANALVQLGFPLFLKRVPADSPVVTALQDSYRGRGIVISRLVTGCPWIPLHAGWTLPDGHLNSARRSDLRRARRIAETMGAVRYQVLSPTPGELHPLLEQALRVEAASWKGRTGTALATDAVRGMFYRRYAASACEKGILRLCFLRIGGQAVAMQLAVECGERFWLLKIGYDAGFARCSPGTLLMLETIRYAAARGLRSYEFLGTVEPWTGMWTRLVRPCVSLRAYPLRVQGVAALAADVTKIAYQKIRLDALDK